MKKKPKNPPKNNLFLGLVALESGDKYWDIFFWATKEDGVNSAQFVDRGLFAMPTIERWEYLPEID
ncbi:hypothetical protein KUA24_139 [Vibrio phage HNL01]|nr:hypothetical protein KUA24_139 [Vibrio phage HNL01]